MHMSVVNKLQPCHLMNDIYLSGMCPFIIYRIYLYFRSFRDRSCLYAINGYSKKEGYLKMKDHVHGKTVMKRRFYTELKTIVLDEADEMLNMGF